MMWGVLMARRGRKRRLEMESEYWRLLLSGVGTVEACQLVGIGRKTGYRWRAENGGLPPQPLPETDRSARYLSLLERQRIASLRGQGLDVRAIVEHLGRAPSTISRELRRNVAPRDCGYDGDVTHARARERARPGRAGSGRMSSCVMWCRPGWGWSGARSRSRAGCVVPIRIGRVGGCATRRSTRRSTSAVKAVLAAS